MKLSTGVADNRYRLDIRFGTTLQIRPRHATNLGANLNPMVWKREIVLIRPEAP